MAIALIGFGANLGSPAQAFDEVIAALRLHPKISSVAASQLIASQPIGGPVDQPLYFNGAIRVATAMSPQELFSLTCEIETAFGRVREVQWGPREIDLDLLLFDEVKLQTPSLILPHPRFHYRRFALAPAREVAPSMVHPVFALRVSQLLSRLDRLPRITAIAGTDPASVLVFASELATRTGAFLLDRAELNAAAFPSECILSLHDFAPQTTLPQLVLWIGDGAIPQELVRPLQDSAFSTWISLDLLSPEAALTEATAAVASMRPFA